MRSGKQPIPTEAHKLRGSYNPTRHGRDRAGEPKPTDDLHETPPSGLTANQRAEWDHQLKYFPRGVIKEADRRWLLIWVKLIDRWELATTTLQREAAEHPEHPFQVEDENGRWRLSPLVGVVERAETALARVTAELGFSPAARTRIYTGPSTSEAPVAPAWGAKIAA